ncbi:helix-turn-helix domain-containing protein [Alkaliphilus peptidifermentans]|uniref:Helix-turn-helix domain-containing protein n=1 Tax=Alkaliphilus peptidifermentans DSM 18978 TaxID=1120976 RepID=A0A1G5IUC9_9FIRM|nr:helix-turn-helix transcriptional regulator [Alkaliphilus peptidifermentans]SCY79682.1 Helix-turn-helix domain-containing protein [Alkaliphilus peptidifermentans DSM 18978]
MSRVGKRIQDERIKKGMTPKQLGKKCGVAESFIIDIEGGRKIINEKLFAQISKALGTDLEEAMILAPNEDEKREEKIERKLPKPTADRSIKRNDIEPFAQWGEALSNIIKQIPIYDVEMVSIRGYKAFPVIDKKVEGFNPDKLIYIEAADDSLSQYRIKRNDRCLIYLNHEFMNGSFHLLEYDNKRYLRRIKKVDGNKVQLIEGTGDKKPIIIDVKGIKILGRLIRVEIDF